jgi:hypothetical protein
MIAGVLSDFRFLVVGLVRNCANTVRADLETFKVALARVGRLEFLLIESDSSDGTLDALENYRRIDASFSYISLGKLQDRFPLRTERIAFCRNRYLQEIRLNSRYSNFDYVIVADFDGVNARLTESSIESCFTRDGWDVCCSNQEGAYYDIWALRHQSWCPCDCWEHQHFLKQLGLSRAKSTQLAVHDRMIPISKSVDWISVESAFGGCAIYRRDILLQGFYKGISPEGIETCEHVELHRQIRELGGKIFINPAFINGGLNEHSKFCRGFFRWTFGIRCFIRDLWLSG